MCMYSLLVPFQFLCAGEGGLICERSCYTPRAATYENGERRRGRCSCTANCSACHRAHSPGRGQPHTTAVTRLAGASSREGISGVKVSVHSHTRKHTSLTEPLVPHGSHTCADRCGYTWPGPRPEHNAIALAPYLLRLLAARARLGSGATGRVSADRGGGGRLTATRPACDSLHSMRCARGPARPHSRTRRARAHAPSRQGS